MIDELDRRVIAALQLNGRASWNSVSRWVGVSETTAQRRYQALRERRLVHVVGALELDRTESGSSMLVRVHAKPGKGLELAEVLAECPEVRFLAVVTGTADLIVDFVAQDNEQLMRLLFTDLPGAHLITGTECVAVIRNFTSAAMWDTGLLPPEAAADLRPATLAPPCDRDDWDQAPQALSGLEQAVADGLAADGRLPVSTLARRLERSESSVSRALDRLVERGSCTSGPSSTRRSWGTRRSSWCGCPSSRTGSTPPGGSSRGTRAPSSSPRPPAGSTWSATWCCPAVPTCSVTPVRSSAPCRG